MYLFESGITPFPIGVDKNGSLVLLINYITILDALAYAAPFPIIIRGDLLYLINLTALLIYYGSANDLGMLALENYCNLLSILAFKISPGISIYTGPGLPDKLTLTHYLMK